MREVLLVMAMMAVLQGATAGLLETVACGVSVGSGADMAAGEAESKGAEA